MIDANGGPRGTLIVADRVITLGRGRTEARAILVRGKRIVWVGDHADDAPPHASMVDLHGCTIGPAFVDSHVHLTPTGLSLTGLDLGGASSGRELLEMVRTYAQQHTGRVIWGHGYDDHSFPDPLPTADELAEVAGERAVYLSRTDVHSALVDRQTLASAPLARADGIERDQDGSPTGVVRREAHHIVRRWALGGLSDEELSAARDAAARRAASLGVGSVHEMGGPDIMGEADFDAWRAGRWPVEVVPYWGAMDLGFAIERELKQSGGDLYLDGSLGSRTAALCEPYADREGSGHLYIDDGELQEYFREATLAGIQVAVHAIGDAAVRQVVRCWRAVEADLPDYLEGEIRRLRHRVEHLELVPPDLAPEIADLGLVASVQPAFEARWGGAEGMYERRLGSDRAQHMNPYRMLADLGVPLAFGSDSNVTEMDPWGTVHAAENRRQARHELSRLEAVSASCLGGRHAARQERFTGTLRAGMRADLAAWEGDPYAADDPRGTPCVLTLVKGRITHGEAPLQRWDERLEAREDQAH